MTFSSPIFLFAFLPVLCLLYWLIPGIRAKNALLMVASLVFYGAGQPTYVLLLLDSVIWNYIGGRLVCGARAKLWLWTVITGNLALLCVYKYLGFFTENLNLLLHMDLPVPQIVLPIGISFFTFQGMSYVIDVYRDPESVSRRFTDVLLYISFFPQLVAGPIVKYKDIASFIRERSVTLSDTASGVRRFVIGLSKKLLIADTMHTLVTAVYGMSAAQLDARSAWLGAIAYTL